MSYFISNMQNEFDQILGQEDECVGHSHGEKHVKV